MKSKPEEPTSANFLVVVGWLTIIASVVAGIATISNSDSDAVISMALGFAFGGIAFGILLLGFATVIRKLCEIEHHLKGPQEQPTEAETSEEENPNIDSASDAER